MRNKIKVKVGNVILGAGNPVRIQSMTNTDTKNVRATVKQIKELEKSGCEIVRISVPDNSSADQIPEIKKKIKIPLVADIHFNYKLALLAIAKGVDKIRINPGNIGGKEKIKRIIEKAAEKSVPIRIGVNAGSLKKKYLETYLTSDYKRRAKILNNSLFEDISIFEKEKYFKLVLSLKTSDVLTTIEAYKLAYKNFPYPLHLGVTEAGGLLKGSIRSASALSILLNEGIGDTIRVSLAAAPVNEVIVAKEILASLGKSERKSEVIACPTCARTSIDVIGLTEKLESFFEKVQDKISRKIKIAVMGCVVNGPGEAKDSDFGITGLKGKYYLFSNGKIIKKVDAEKDIFDFIKKLL